MNALVSLGSHFIYIDDTDWRKKRSTLIFCFIFQLWCTAHYYTDYDESKCQSDYSHTDCMYSRLVVLIFFILMK